MTTFWLSYADVMGFRGALIIDGTDFVHACWEARRKGLSPGGQVHGVDLDPGVAALIPAEYRNRLLSEREAQALEVMMDKLIDQQVN